MFGLGGDDVVFLGLVEPRQALDGEVVGFSGSRREDDFFGVRSDEGRDLLVRVRWLG